MTDIDNAERRALRETVRGFVTREVLPYQDEWERAGELPRSLHKRGRRARPDRAVVPGRGRRRGRRRDRRARAGRGVALRRRRRRRVRLAVHVRHLAAAPRRGRRPSADRALGASDARGRTDRLARDHRTRRRFGRRRHPHHGEARRRRLRRQRRQDLHHLRRARRLRRHRGAHGRRRRARHLAARRREGHARLHRVAQAGEDGLACRPTPPSCPTPTCGCRPRTWSARENTGFVQIAQNFVSERIGLAVQAYASAQRASTSPSSGAATARRSAGR